VCALFKDNDLKSAVLVRNTISYFLFIINFKRSHNKVRPRFAENSAFCTCGTTMVIIRVSLMNFAVAAATTTTTTITVFVNR